MAEQGRDRQGPARCRSPPPSGPPASPTELVPDLFGQQLFTAAEPILGDLALLSVNFAIDTLPSDISADITEVGIQAMTEGVLDDVAERPGERERDDPRALSARPSSGARPSSTPSNSWPTTSR